jgi:hypothetical protein
MKVPALASAALGVLACSPPAPTPSPTALVPADYARTYVEVRNCRNTIDHATAVDGQNPSAIRVLVGPEAAEAYRNNRTLPVGAVVVKEEADVAPGCGVVYALTVMRKEPGYDPAHGDWHWQRLRARDRSILEDGRVARCYNASCHGASACVRRDWQCTDP